MIAALLRVLSLVALWRWLQTGRKRWLIILCASFLVGFIDKLNFVWVIGAWIAAAALVSGRHALERLRTGRPVAAADRGDLRGAAGVGHGHAGAPRGAARRPGRRRVAVAVRATCEGVEPLRVDVQRHVGDQLGVRRRRPGDERIQHPPHRAARHRRRAARRVEAVVAGKAAACVPDGGHCVPGHRHRRNAPGRRVAPPAHDLADARAAPRHAARDRDAASRAPSAAAA